MDISFNNSGVQRIFGTFSDGAVFYNLNGIPDGVPQAEHGSFIENTDGSYRYSPAVGFFGIDTLRFADQQSMDLYVAPPEDQGLKDVAQGIDTIGTTISYFEGHETDKSNLVNEELEKVDRQEFNHFSLENNAKWGLMGYATDSDGDGKAWEFEYAPQKLKELAAVAEQAENSGAKLNLHNVLWNQSGNLPEHIVNRYNYEIEQNGGVLSAEFKGWFEDQVGTHIRVLLETLGPATDIIDVINEHIYSQDGGIYDKIYDSPTGYIKFAFAETRRAIDDYNSTRPEAEQIEARLAINEFNVLYNFDDYKYDPERAPDFKADLYYDLVKELIDDGVEIDVVGFQSHLVMERINQHIGQNTDDDDLHNNVPPTGQELYDRVSADLQRFIDLGVDISLSELDVRTYINSTDSSGAVDFEDSDFTMIYEVIGALAHDIPQITDVTLWGTSHDVSWLRDYENDPLLFQQRDGGYQREAEYFAFMEGLTGNSEFNVADPGEGEANGAPQAKFDLVPTDDGNSITVNVLDNDTDPDGGPLTVTAINDVAMQAGWMTWVPDVGLVAVNEDQSLTIEQAGPGSFSFNYTISDGKSESTATVHGTTDNSINDSPDAMDDAVEFTAGETVTVKVLDNDTDPDGDPLTITAINDVAMQAGWTTWVPDVGLVAVNEDQSLDVSQIQSINFSFDYTVSDGANEATATVNGTVATGDNSAPEAMDDAVEFTAGETVTVKVLDNDTDPDGDPLTVTAINDVAMQAGWTTWVADVGLVAVNEDQSLDVSQIQSDRFSFDYTVSDGANEATATVNGSVTDGEIDVPVIEDIAGDTVDDGLEDNGTDVSEDTSEEDAPSGPGQVTDNDTGNDTVVDTVLEANTDDETVDEDVEPVEDMQADTSADSDIGADDSSTLAANDNYEDSTVAEEADGLITSSPDSQIDDPSQGQPESSTGSDDADLCDETMTSDDADVLTGNSDTDNLQKSESDIVDNTDDDGAGEVDQARSVDNATDATEKPITDEKAASNALVDQSEPDEGAVSKTAKADKASDADFVVSETGDRAAGTNQSQSDLENSLMMEDMSFDDAELESLTEDAI